MRNYEKFFGLKGTNFHILKMTNSFFDGFMNGLRKNLLAGEYLAVIDLTSVDKKRRVTFLPSSYFFRVY